MADSADSHSTCAASRRCCAKERPAKGRTEVRRELPRREAKISRRIFGPIGAYWEDGEETRRLTLKGLRSLDHGPGADGEALAQLPAPPLCCMYV